MNPRRIWAVTSESSWVPLPRPGRAVHLPLALGAYAADDVIMLTILMVVPFLTWVATRYGSRPTPTTRSSRLQASVSPAHPHTPAPDEEHLRAEARPILTFA